LRDGRLLGFSEYGARDGEPLFYFHGWPSSRLEAELLDHTAAEMGFRVVAPDRPGYGLSDFKSDRTIAGWAGDVVELADQLALPRFAVLGVSGGGPYAAACAAKIPERLKAALLVCSVAPLDAPDAIKGMVAVNRWLLALARTAPWLAQRIGTLCLRVIWRKGEQVLPKQIEDRLPEADRAALADPNVRDTLIASSIEALSDGVAAAALDGFLYARPWGFRLEEISAPVWVWHGEKDVIVPPSMGHYLAAKIPHCHATFYPEDGHFSLAFQRRREILGVLR
jgi:pimeloyl-ACP methyl ester carboxylesterase